MKKGISYTLLILFSLLMLLPFLGRSQATYTAPIGYNTGAPTAAPSASGTRWRFDLLTGRTYKWSPTAVSWILDGYGIDNVTGCVPPAYTPAYGQSIFAVNGCDSLYGYRAGHWRHLNPGGSGGGTNIYAGSGITFSGISPDITINADDNSAENELNVALYVDAGNLVLDDGGGTVSTPLSQFRQGIYSAGTGIGINLGTGVISNTGDLSTTNEIQTLSISGQDLSLSLGGGTVTLPAGSSLGVGFTAGGGSGTIPVNTDAAITLSSEWVDYTSKILLGNPSYYQTTQGDGYENIGFETVNTTTGAYSFLGYTSDDPTTISLSVGDGGTDNSSVSISPSSLVFSSGGAVQFTGKGDTESDNALLFSIQSGGAVVSDASLTKNGLQYAAEYPDILTNDRSIPDVGLTKTLIASENGALGTGFTDGGGSGTIPIETTATLSEDSYFTVGWFSGGQALYINDEEGQVELKSKDNLTNFYLNNFGLGFGSENDIQFTSLGTLGFTAAIAEFSGGVRIGQFTNAAAPVNTIFYSTTDSKLSYKDPGGAVHSLY